MNESLAGKLALVTGAGRGIGAALARGLARAGAAVVLTDLTLDAVQSIAQELRADGGRAWAYALDICDAATCHRVASQVAAEAGVVAILVNNAGVQLRGGALDDPETPDKWRGHFAVNVDGPFNVTRAFLGPLRETRGCIVNVASIQSFVANLVSPGYAASKGALLQFTRTMAAQLATEGIRVNAIAPGLTETPMTDASRANAQHMERYLQHVPMRRFAGVEEMVGPVLFLASDAASYVTGVTLPVDGGYLVV
ncbi:MAG TPA: SDR family oxidoreductase [Burkholderiaceae bacterium]|nr:SDR family oxidoreductase [Burkholderiaceae bacterium]